MKTGSRLQCSNRSSGRKKEAGKTIENRTQPELVPNQASKSNIVRGALNIDCNRLLRARLWKLYDEGPLFGRLRGGRGGAVEYMKELYMKQLEHPDED